AMECYEGGLPRARADFLIAAPVARSDRLFQVSQMLRNAGFRVVQRTLRATGSAGIRSLVEEGDAEGASVVAMLAGTRVAPDEAFYRTAHRKIYLAMLDLSEHGEVIDQITMTECLKAKGELESVGGAAYLAELVQAVPTAANIKYHCKIVRDKALLRGLIGTSTEVITRGYDGAA